MELIDRVAFMNDLVARIELNKNLCRDGAQYRRVCIILNGFFRDLKEFPTVEVDGESYNKGYLEGYKKGYKDRQNEAIADIMQMLKDIIS